jgi:hypothetical protein
VAQGKGSEFKLQYEKKKRKERNNGFQTWSPSAISEQQLLEGGEVYVEGT